MTIPWSNDLSVHVKEIDEQHQTFLGILNSLYNDHSILEIKDILFQLESYAIFHFSTEEGYFDKFNYELSIEHKDKHKQLLAKVKEFNYRFIVEEKALLPELLSFLEDWLVDHLSTQDKKYSKCFNDNGLF